MALKDSAGFAIETVLDIASVIGSVAILVAQPSLKNLGNLVWDVGSVLIPFVPGSYVGKAGKIVVKVADKLDDFANGSQLLVGSYNALKRLSKGLNNVEVHHLIEKRFNTLFKGSTGKYLSIVLSDEIHQAITNAWRNLHKVDPKFVNFAYGSDYSLVTYDLMVDAVKTVYKDIYKVYVDDGYSGLNFNRPGFQELLDDVDQGKVNMVITKDLSRLGRDYIMTGYYSEIFFPSKNVRYIAIADNFDSLKSDNDIAPFKNILNDMYARDISRKIKNSKHQRAKNGLQKIAQPP